MNRILIASILKPVNDPRMYEKFGISIGGLEGVEVHIAGYKEVGSGKWEDRSGKMENKGIVFHPIYNFKRISLARAFAPFKLFKTLLKVKPQIIIATTIELLPVTILHKILFGGVLLYDIQENYYRNLRFNNTYPPVIRDILALYSRTVEYLSMPFIRYCFLAERNYENEFTFSKGKSLILENKYRKPPGEPELIKPKTISVGRPVKLLYSGTISEGYGIFEAIHLAEKLHNIHQNVTLTIIGYCANKQDFDRLEKNISGKSFISLIGGDTLVPHSLILEEIRTTDLGLLSYQPNKSTENCIPTRLFEYQAHLLPMIIQENRLWRQICEPDSCAVFIDYKSVDPSKLLEQIFRTRFYPTGVNPQVFWKSEEEKLLPLIKNIMK